MGLWESCLDERQAEEYFDVCELTLTPSTVTVEPAMPDDVISGPGEPSPITDHGNPWLGDRPKDGGYRGPDHLGQL